jgi:hypothetical protein
VVHACARGEKDLDRADLTARAAQISDEDGDPAHDRTSADPIGRGPQTVMTGR